MTKDKKLLILSTSYFPFRRGARATSLATYEGEVARALVVK